MNTLLLAASPLFAPVTSDQGTYGMGIGGLLAGGLFIVMAISMAADKDRLMTLACCVLGSLFLAIGAGGILYNGGFEPPMTSEEHAEQVAEWLDDEYEIDVTSGSAAALLDGEALSVEYNDTDVLIELHRSGDDGITVYSVDTKTSLQPIAEVG